MNREKAKYLGMAPLVIRGPGVLAAIDACQTERDIELFGATFRVVRVEYECGQQGETSSAVELQQLMYIDK